MALPRIDVPSYSAILPSTGESVKFRPFLVREQKQLLIALAGDEEQQTQAARDLVEACTQGVVTVKTHANYDIEYLFLQIRARSVGETVDLILTCGECQNQQNASLDITSITVDRPAGHDKNIDLGGGITLVMREPNPAELSAVKESNDPDAIIALVAHGIQSIFKQDELFSAGDYSEAELIDFVENLSPDNLVKINNYFATLPALRHALEFTCSACGADNVAVLEGLQSFFG